MDRGSSSRESKAPANVKGGHQTPALLSFSVPPNLTMVVPAALWWLLCVAKQRHPLSMTREEEWQRIKGEEAFPVPRESCLFHGTDGCLRATPQHATRKAGDLRSLASQQEADKAEGLCQELSESVCRVSHAA